MINRQNGPVVVHGGENDRTTQYQLSKASIPHSNIVKPSRIIFRNQTVLTGVQIANSFGITQSGFIKAMRKACLNEGSDFVVIKGSDLKVFKSVAHQGAHFVPLVKKRAKALRLYTEQGICKIGIFLTSHRKIAVELYTKVLTSLTKPSKTIGGSINRTTGVIERKNLNDSIFALVELALTQDSTQPQRIWNHVTNWVHSAIFENPKAAIKNRDWMEPRQLLNLATLEAKVSDLLNGMLAREDADYKAIKRAVKAFSEDFGQMIGKTIIEKSIRISPKKIDNTGNKS